MTTSTGRAYQLIGGPNDGRVEENVPGGAWICTVISGECPNDPDATCEWLAYYQMKHGTGRATFDAALTEEKRQEKHRGL